MTHPDADTLLRFVLQTLDESDTTLVREHLSRCEDCSELKGRLQGNVDTLEGIEFHADIPTPPPLPERSRLRAEILKLAAVLATGFFLGYLTEQLVNPVRPLAVQQRLIPIQGTVSSAGFVSCQAVDVKTESQR